MVNHLWTTHYHMGLIFAHCQDYFTTSADTMCQHAQLCKPMTASNDDDGREEEDYEDNVNGSEFIFEED